MPRQNRVSPEGSLHAVPERGAFMGNRGILHHEGRIQRNHAHKAWITCLLSFKSRQRAVMSEGRYTELFFLDEATSYAAGHRPCAECRRADYLAFAKAWAGLHGPSKAPEIDRCLHAERLQRRDKRVFLAAPADLPDGVMLRGPSGPVLKWRGFHDWSFAGYRRCEIEAPEVEVLTPPSITALLRAGLSLQVHESAQ